MIRLTFHASKTVETQSSTNIANQYDRGTASTSGKTTELERVKKDRSSDREEIADKPNQQEAGLKHDNASFNKAIDHLFKITNATCYTLPSSSRTATTEETTEHQLDLEDDSIVELKLDDGGTLFIRADELPELLQQENKQELTLTSTTPIQGQPYDTEASRGIISDIFKSFTPLEIDWKNAAAKTATDILKNYIRPLEERLLKSKPGLLHWDHETNQWVDERHITPSDKPVLIFLHGTASSTENSFGALWGDSNQKQWNTFISKYYQGNVYALNHRSLSESPINNAIDLLTTLGQDQEIHLVSHSRGGLIGELLCRGDLSPEQKHRNPISSNDIALYESAYQGNADANQNRQVPGSVHQYLGELNQLLLDKKPKISRFVRIACPSRGTTLADHRADLYLSVIFSVLEKTAALVNPLLGTSISLVKALAISTAKLRMDFEVLPGLECMMPNSGLIKMINYSSIQVSADLSVIAGNAKTGDSLFQAGSFSEIRQSLKQTLWVALSNAYYLQANDFVVETKAMDGGNPRYQSTYIYQDKGSTVSHFNYFRNPISRQQLVHALTRDKKHPAGFNFLEQSREDQQKTKLRSSLPQLEMASINRTKESIELTGIVIMIPDFGGNHLTLDGERIWASARNLALGKLEELRLSTNSDISTGEILKEHYQSLATFLTSHHQQDVITHSYDWRQSISHNSQHLAIRIEELIRTNPDKPIRILAHGMGGLITQHLMISRPKLWNLLQSDHDGQCIMAGTPFSGSYEAVQVLLQQSPLLYRLAPLHADYSVAKVASVFSEFPSLIEMLPSFNKQALKHKFFTQASWKRLFRDFNIDTALKPALDIRQSKTQPDKNTLAHARKIQRDLIKQPEFSHKIHYLAGQDKTTIAGLKEDKKSENTDANIYFTSSSLGDGFTLWEQIPDWFDKSNIWFLPHVKHGDLFRHSEHFTAITELLLNGTTSLLAHTPPHNRSITSRKIKHLEETPFLLPERRDLEAMMLHGSTNLPKNYDKKQLAHIRIIHGNLKQLDTPIMVGHYVQDSIRGSEAVVDEQLQGWLSELYDNGLYPGNLNTVEIIINPANPESLIQKAKGAIIVGLGSIGELTTPNLRRTLRNAMIRYGLHHAEILKNCNPDEGNKPLLLSSLLIGAGTGGVNIEDSVSCLLNALQQANEKLHSLNKPAISRLDIIELYEDIAISAAIALQRMEQLFKPSMTMDTIIKPFPGKQVRSTISAYETWWRHVQILGKDNDSLIFTPLTSSAGMHTMTHQMQPHLVDSILQQATQDAQINLRLSRTLFELLLPNNMKEQVRDENGMVLLLNELSARYPWEMLVSEQSYHKPLSTEIGFIRKLHSIDIQPHRIIKNRQALVVGDTQSNLPALPGAQEEAMIVHRSLLDAGYTSRKPLIRCSGIEIVSTLMSQPVQIMHLAGHGVFLEKDTVFDGEYYANGISGMVLGNNHFLTHDEIQSLPCIPELVFINCCHLGKIKSEVSAEIFQSRSKLAANLGTAFIQAGAKCVIAAGWEVDDRAALMFADEFYFQMLNENKNFGDAVQLARKKVFQHYPTTNTWGAYQCYGDHKFRFKGLNKSSKEIDEEKHHSATQTIIWANNISSMSWTNNNDRVATRKSINHRAKQIPPEWQQNAELHEAIASAYAAINSFSKAIKWYDKAVACNDARITLRALEQKANVLVRWAENEYSSSGKEELQDPKDAIAHTQTSIELISNLINISKNEERLNLLASTYKHQALIQFSSKDRLTTEAKKNLCRAYDYYLQAESLHFDATQEHDSYPLLNAIAIWLGFDESSCSKDNTFQPKPASLISRYINKLNEQLSITDDENQYDFWKETDRLNLSLTKSLLKKSLDEGLCSILLNDYQTALAGATPKEANSVLKQIRFLDEYLKLAWKGKGLTTNRRTALTNLAYLRKELDN